MVPDTADKVVARLRFPEITLLTVQRPSFALQELIYIIS